MHSSIDTNSDMGCCFMDNVININLENAESREYIRERETSAVHAPVSLHASSSSCFLPGVLGPDLLIKDDIET